ncbi:MAG: single-stranded-DNA-specific exonuclease RecJ [Longimicrobiales bacterium]
MTTETTARVSLALPARKWVRRALDADAAAIDRLESELHLPRALCMLLAQRGCADPAQARSFLKPRIDSLTDPFRLADMDAAVTRIVRAIDDGERILVHGDYDVDGICGAALFTLVLRSLGALVEPFVPHRLTDGYDLGHAGIRRATEVDAKLILTVDCGIVAHDAVQAARAAGIDVIITDHHTPGPRLPAAVAVINPNRADCTFPEKGLVGAGVAFKVCQALTRARGGDEQALLWHLDLVAIATIADLAPLQGENRALTHYGLRVLEQTRNTGLAALLHAAALDPRLGLSAGQISHGLAPRLNAVGRMGAAARGVKLLLCEDPLAAAPLAAETEEENRSRQNVDRETLRQALEMLEATYDPQRDYGVVLAAEGWHPGVIGIVASRVVERIHRPVIMIALDPETQRGRGSARSIPAFDLYGAIDKCGRWLERYGGHHQAAGMEVRADRIASFRTAFNEQARAMLAPADLIPECKTDIELRLGEANAELLKLLRHFGPFGMGNPAPVFVSKGVMVVGYPKEVGDGHLKLMLQQDSARMPAIGFRMADKLQTMDVTRGPIDVAYQLQENHYNGRVEMQAKLIDFRMTQ